MLSAAIAAAGVNGMLAAVMQAAAIRYLFILSIPPVSCCPGDDRGPQVPAVSPGRGTASGSPRQPRRGKRGTRGAVYLFVRVLRKTVATAWAASWCSDLTTLW